MVAILDADKEGFLRSDRALIQTIGRAARHINGKAILYADRITPSMQRAIDETERRRRKQIEFNTAHGITPRSAVRQVVREIDTGEVVEPVNDTTLIKSAPINIDEHLLRDPNLLAKHIKQLEQAMITKARELKFEEAARLRDEVTRLKAQLVS
jgi:excinuclease ABC subunit B